MRPGEERLQGPPSPHPSRQVQTRELRPVSRFCEAHLRPLAGRFGTSLRSRTAAEGPSPRCRIWVVLNSGDAGGMRSEAGAHPEEWACVGQPRRGMPRSSVLSSALSVCLPSPLLPHSQLLGTFPPPGRVCGATKFLSSVTRIFPYSSGNSLLLRKTRSAHKDLGGNNGKRRVEGTVVNI